MGMTCGLVRATEQEIARLRTNPEEIVSFIEGDEWAPPQREVRHKGLAGWLLRLTPVRVYEADPYAVAPRRDKTDVSGRHLDLDKGWHPLHFLLTGTAWEGAEPECYLARAGEELVDRLDSDDTGYSSIRALNVSDVRRFAESLNTLSAAALRERFDVRKMIDLEIYPKPRATQTSSREDELEHLVELFDQLRTFVEQSARDGEGLIVYLT
jgi:hypothetical protein